MREGYRKNILKTVSSNTKYRKILYTDKNLQLVTMCIQPKQEIGWEKHDVTQYIEVRSGRAKVNVGSSVYYLKRGDVVIVPCRKKHNVTNISKNRVLKISTI